MPGAVTWPRAPENRPGGVPVPAVVPMPEAGLAESAGE
jgi:hypothetical protein